MAAGTDPPPSWDVAEGTSKLPLLLVVPLAMRTGPPMTFVPDAEAEGLDPRDARDDSDEAAPLVALVGAAEVVAVAVAVAVAATPFVAPSPAMKVGPVYPLSPPTVAILPVSLEANQGARIAH